jgi:hypothetical protein
MLIQCPWILPSMARNFLVIVTTFFTSALAETRGFDNVVSNAPSIDNDDRYNSGGAWVCIADVNDDESKVVSNEPNALDIEFIHHRLVRPDRGGR